MVTNGNYRMIILTESYWLIFVSWVENDQPEMETVKNPVPWHETKHSTFHITMDHCSFKDDDLSNIVMFHIALYHYLFLSRSLYIYIYYLQTCIYSYLKLPEAEATFIFSWTLSMFGSEDASRPTSSSSVRRPPPRPPPASARKSRLSGDVCGIVFFYVSLW